MLRPDRALRLRPGPHQTNYGTYDSVAERVMVRYGATSWYDAADNTPPTALPTDAPAPPPITVPVEMEDATSWYDAKDNAG